MKNNTAKKAIALYYILSLSLTLPLLIPLWFIGKPICLIIYFVFLYIYTKIAAIFAVRVTIMSSLWKELDAEKYAAIINAKPFRFHYSYKLNLYFAIGDYQAAYNSISSLLLQHKNYLQRIFGHLLLCRICFERGDYEGIKDNLDQIESYLKYSPDLRLSKQNKESYEFYRAFSNADYVSACAFLQKGIEKYSKKKNGAYFSLMRQYPLAVIKRMNSDIDEAVLLFEAIKEKSPKLVLSTLAQKQLEYISGTLEEETPERLEVTENYPVKSHGKIRIVLLIGFCLICILLIASEIMVLLDNPKQEYKDREYMSKIESTLYDDYEEYKILGYLGIYSDDAYKELVDSVFLIEADGRIDLHTLYKLNEKDGNNLNVKDIQIDKPYVYENMFSKKIEFVLTEKKRDIPDNTLYYYGIDGYYFCVISVSDI